MIGCVPLSFNRNYFRGTLDHGVAFFTATSLLSELIALIAGIMVRNSVIVNRFIQPSKQRGLFHLNKAAIEAERP